jgi:hypothetical protein
MPTTAEMEWTPTRQAILGHQPELQLYGEVSVWFHKLRLFRKGEEQRIYQENPSADDLEIHKQLLRRLITDGEHLLLVVGQGGGLTANPELIKVEDLKAAIESLHDTFRGMHEPMAAEQREKILKDVFGDVT